MEEKSLFENDQLSKVRMIMDHLNKVMLDAITPENPSSDESVMLWRWRLVFWQHIKSKRHKYGNKFNELCTHDGLVLTVEAYGGPGFNAEHNLGQTAAITVKITNPFLNKGYHVFTDSYYNTVTLTEFLSKQSTYVTGKLRKYRKSNSKKVTARKRKKGEMV